MRKIFASLLVAVVGMLLIQPAGAVPPEGDCPPGWTEDSDAGYEEYDRNGDDSICYKEVNGRGNTGDNRNVKDNNRGSDEPPPPPPTP